MEFFQSLDPLYSIAGFCVGALVGLTGVGGGSLMTPLLILLFGIQPATAVGTDLLYAAATKAGGTLVHGLGRNVQWRIVGRMALGSAPAAALTLAGMAALDLEGGASPVISVMLGLALLCTALCLIFRRQIASLYSDRVGELDLRRTRRLTIATGAGLGLLVSLTSVGAGAIGVTVLVLLYPRLGTRQIVGSDIAHAVPLTLIAGTGHWLMGSVDWVLFASLLLGSLPGIILGSRIAGRVPDLVLRPILAGTLLVVGGKLLF